MTTTIEAVFDGQVLRPSEPLAIEPNSRVRVTIEVLPAADQARTPVSFLETAMSLNLEGPPNWSSDLHMNLYGDECDHGS